jgi:hypothetical protein
MSPVTVDLNVEGLVSRAHDVDRFLALYRVELSRIPADRDDAADAMHAELEELGDLLGIVEDLWETVAGRTARLYEEMQSRVLSEQVERELASHGEKWDRYLNFAAAAGIRVPVPMN